MPTEQSEKEIGLASLDFGEEKDMAIFEDVTILANGWVEAKDPDADSALNYYPPHAVQGVYPHE